MLNMDVDTKAAKKHDYKLPSSQMSRFLASIVYVDENNEENNAILAKILADLFISLLFPVFFYFKK